MNCLHIRPLSGLALVTALLWGTGPAWASGGWTVVTSPNVGANNNALVAVASISATDLWAVGDEYNPGAGQVQTLVEHWNGNTWTAMTSPNVGSGTNALVSVAAVSTSNVWAVGYERDPSVNRFHTLVEHWNGAAWSAVPSPNVGPGDSVLEGVVALSASNVWAVGYATGTLIEHWNGVAWSVIDSPNPGSAGNVLYSVTAITPTNIWAAGYFANVGRKMNIPRTLVEHWNGTSWTVVSSPSPGTRSNVISGLAATSPTDVWAVGHYYTSGDIFETLVEHWNGSSWSQVLSPNPSSIGNSLGGVTAVSSSDVWAVGSVNGFPTATLIEHWNGSSWSVTSSPSPGANSNSLSGVTAISASKVWAVGYDTSGTSGPQQTLIEHCC